MTKTLHRLLAYAALPGAFLTVGLRAADPAPGPSPTALSAEESAFATLKANVDQWDHDEDQAKTPEDELRAHDKYSTLADQAVLDFLQAYPQTSHRWEAAQIFIEHRPYFFTDVKHDPGLSEDSLLAASKQDPRALAKWRSTADGWVSQLDQDPSVAPEVVLATHQGLLQGDLEDAGVAAQRGEKVDLAALRERVHAHIARFASDDKVRIVAYDYIYAVQAAQPARVDEEWKAFTQSPNGRVREVAEARVRWAKVKAAPIQLKFVSADGTAVDLEKLRGKVVLLDFWATWCPPCREEVPNVVALYQKYHDKGFEIIGVALENKPTPDKLLAFTKDHGMTWPQLNGGKRFKSDAALDFAVFSIPHTVLLDRSGNVVAEDVRGPTLEPAVRGQLGL